MYDMALIGTGVVLVTQIVVFIFKFGGLSTSVKLNSSNIEKLDTTLGSIDKKLDRADNRLVRIETILSSNGKGK